MARSPRHFVPGYPSHVTHRGNNRQRIFHCEGDYRFLWNCIKEGADEHRVAVNAYVFMSNHVHLLMTPDEYQKEFERIMVALATVSRDIRRKQKT